MNRNRNRKTIDFKKIAKIICVLAAAAAAVKAFTLTSPLIIDAVAKTAVISAGITMPEGGINLLGNTLRADSEEEINESAQHNEEDPDVSDNPTEENNSNTEISDNQSTETKDTSVNNSGGIIRKTYTSAGSNLIDIGSGAAVKNSTDITAQEILNEVGKSPAFHIEKNGQPQVLLYHTHATESYENIARDFFDSAYNARSTDNTKNMVAVGNKIAEALEAAGITVIHDITQHDYPSYNGSYNRSAETVQKYKDQYPSIKVTLDIHRDAIESNNKRYAPVVEINGKNAAQVMIISGCENGKLNYPNWKNNLNFALATTIQMQADYPGLARPLLFKYVRYNQHLSDGAYLIEVGGHGNSLDEALYSGELIGKSLAKTLESTIQ